MSHNCNKYIISEGKFIRDFEGMYREFDDPWSQAADVKNDLFNNTAFFLLHQVVSRKNLRIQRILDVGCAFGYHAGSLLALCRGEHYTGTDVSATAIQKAVEHLPKELRSRTTFKVSDLRKLEPQFHSQFDLVFSSKTLYYVAPEIDTVLEHLCTYLRPAGLFCFVYNTTAEAFSNRWLTYEGLRDKLLGRGFRSCVFAELNRFSEEICAIGVFEAPSA